jgi:hypothetical protein
VNNDQELEQLVARARALVISPEQREAQRRSFAFGNVAMENPRVTRALVDARADELMNRDGAR